MIKRRRRGCECGTDLPGRCPGPENCPYASHPDDDEPVDLDDLDDDIDLPDLWIDDEAGP
jgi:hypothetical protein